MYPDACFASTKYSEEFYVFEGEWMVNIREEQLFHLCKKRKISYS